VNILASTRLKTEAMLETIRALQGGNFPQTDAGATLQAIETIFATHLDRIRDLEQGGAPDAAPTYCSIVTQDLFTLLPVIGFLQRSSETRNAFEVYAPLRRLALEVIGADTKLVVSSEWDFSPYTLLHMPGLPSFVLLGSPASEAHNVLLAPLAGHEFGHSIWPLEDGNRTYERPIQVAVVHAIQMRWREYQSYFPNVADGTLTTDFFSVQTWLPAVAWALRQCEEIFCDLTALRIFGEAYLHAFAYLVAPDTGGGRPPYYPTISQRVSYLERAAGRFGVNIPAGYSSLFLSAAAQPTDANAFLLSVADEAVQQQVDSLVEQVDRYLTGRGIALPPDSEVDAVSCAFDNLVPAADPSGLPAIVNAGWRAAHNTNLWTLYPKVVQRRQVVLNELLLKSAQVLEVNELTRDPT
jgi:hypothetical protein